MGLAGFNRAREQVKTKAEAVKTTEVKETVVEKVEEVVKKSTKKPKNLLEDVE